MDIARSLILETNLNGWKKAAMQAAALQKKVIVALLATHLWCRTAGNSFELDELHVFPEADRDIGYYLTDILGIVEATDIFNGMQRRKNSVSSLASVNCPSGLS